MTFDAFVTTSLPFSTLSSSFASFTTLGRFLKSRYIPSSGRALVSRLAPPLPGPTISDPTINFPSCPTIASYFTNPKLSPRSLELDNLLLFGVGSYDVVHLCDHHRQVLNNLQ